ncbi:unnamed protein product [Staurois parvus]|uniref:CAP-Gly domain-containing protein n=1 Tax=Staurois parvus TaxID=386267 RepID=A0ABN9E5G6_9NEOB|nr:unnamed protein product [Staurois parvus]
MLRGTLTGPFYVKGAQMAHIVERGTLVGTCEGKGHSDGEYDRKGYFECKGAL